MRFLLISAVLLVTVGSCFCIRLNQRRAIAEKYEERNFLEGLDKRAPVDKRIVWEAYDRRAPLEKYDERYVLEKYDKRAPLEKYDERYVLEKYDKRAPLEGVDKRAPLEGVDKRAPLDKRDLYIKYDKRRPPVAYDKRGIILDILTGGKTATDYISCCNLMPQLNALTAEANQLRLQVAGCQSRLQDVVNKLVGTGTEKRFLLDILRKPLEIATDIVKLPFQIAGQVVAVPFNIAKGLASAVEPIIGSQLTNIIKFPIDFASRVAQVPFAFGEAVVQLPFGIVSEITGWSFKSREEREKAKVCCQTITGLPAFLTYIRGLREAAAVCESKLQELVVIVDDILNKPTCPQGFYYSDTTDRCYAVFGNPTKYDEGQALCGGVGGVLASIRSQSEQTLIENVIKSIPDTSQCSCNRGGACFTTSGQTLDPNACGTGNGRLVWKPKPGYYMEIGYTNWKAGEPNCYGGYEHCMVLDAFFNYQWNDYSCDTKTCPICEAEPTKKTVIVG